MFDTNMTPLNISKKNEEKITTFIDLALEFNKTHNIFVRKNAKEVFEKDIVDCLPITSEILDKESVLDLGSGGGFPGILIGILKPNNKVCLVESSSKKCYFLKKTVHELSLKNILFPLMKSIVPSIFDFLWSRLLLHFFFLLPSSWGNSNLGKLL